MDLLTVFLIAIGLAMDAFAVSVANSMSHRPLTVRQTLKMTGAFGVFQALMPVLGWLLGLGFRTLIASFDHWIAFGLLAVIGGKMIADSTKGDHKKPAEALSNYTILILAIATSIDAMAVGLSMSLLETPILVPAIIIGVVAFIISLIGVAIGTRFGKLLQAKAAFAGGVILIGIGIKILIDHMM